MNLKINYLYQKIYIVIFTIFLFFWGMDLEPVIYPFIKPGHKYFFLSDIKLSYSIIFLLFPIFYNYIKKKASSLKQVFNYQKYIMIFTLFVVAHFFIVKIYYHEIINKTELANLLYLILLSLIFCHYRNFISNNFKNIITFYLIIFILYSIYEGSQIGSQIYNVGQCRNDIYLISLIKNIFKISLTNSIYRENSHLAMMSVAVFISSMYILSIEKKNNFYFLFLSLIGIIILFNNLSTTYFICYFFSIITLLLFLSKKFNLKFWIISLLILILNLSLFFSDKHCVMKVTDFKIDRVKNDKLNATPANLTTKVYERSIIVSKKTLMNYPLGWGIDGMDNAHHNLFKDYKDNYFDGDFLSKRSGINLNAPPSSQEEEISIFYTLRTLNVKDGLSNIFKMFTEFGIFVFIILFYFIKYILNLKNINSYNIFIIVLFVTLCIRGAGYFNGGFIFCLFEFFYYKKFVDELKGQKNDYLS